MSAVQASRSLIWAARGRTWGYRFLLDGGHSDPLPAYEEALARLGDLREGCDRSNSVTALRLLDPDGRRDASRRVILHEFVAASPMSDDVGTVAEGRARIWPLVADLYAEMWSQPAPPASERVRIAIDLRAVELEGQFGDAQSGQAELGG